MKFLKIFGIVIIPFLSIVYGMGELYGWWDLVSGRKIILDSYERLIHGGGYPNTFIYTHEKEFDNFKNYIEDRTLNPQIKTLSSQGEEPSLISIDGGGAKTWVIPKDWPISVTIPGDAQILFIYGVDRSQTKDTIRGKTTWVGSLYDLKNWTDASLDKQRFWFTVVLISVLSILIGLPELFKKK